MAGHHAFSHFIYIYILILIGYPIFLTFAPKKRHVGGGKRLIVDVRSLKK